MSKQISKLEDLKGNLSKMGPQFKAALPSHVPVEKFTRVLMTAISSTPDLQEASRVSLFSSCMKLAQQGLLPDGKEAAIVTFNVKGTMTAQAMPMMAGLMKLVRNSGEIASISPHVVYKNDKFDYWIDENGEHLNHRPELTGDRGDISHAYCMAKTKDGAVYIEVMSKGELDKVRNSSRAKNGGPWSTWYGEMAKKTVFRRLSKRLPMSTDIDMTSIVDDADETIFMPDAPVIQPPQDVTPKTKPSKLAEAMNVTPEPQKNYAPTFKDESPAAIQDEETPI